MRFLLVLALCCTTLAARADEVKFVRVWTDWKNAESFDRISEYLGGAENTSGEHVARTHPELRDGYYFLVRIAAPTALVGAKFQLQIIRPDAPEAKTFEFPASAPAGTTAFEVGLTGADWPGGKKAHPVAWKLALLAADGHELAVEKSFLWEKPAK
jgi:hypothetical protein